MAFPWFLYIVKPSVNPPYGDCQLPVRGAFWAYLQAPILASLTEGGGCEQSEQTEGLKKKVASHGIVNPSVNPPYGDCQLPVRGAFLYSTIKLLHPLPYICVTCVTSSQTG